MVRFKVTTGLTLALLLGTMLAISGCRLFVKEDPPPCPRVSILADAARLVRFRPGPGRDITDIDLRAQVTNYQGSCFYDKDSRTMQVTLQVGIDAQRGPAMTDDSRQLDYFVALPTFFPQPEAKRIIPLTLHFSKTSDAVHVTDSDVQISFPVKNIKELERYELFIGLQLDDAELEYNRRHHGE